MVALETDGFIPKSRKRKSNSYFVGKDFIDTASDEINENWRNRISLQQIEPFSSPETKVNKDIENENIQLENIQRKIPLLHHDDTPEPRIHQKKTKNSYLNKSTYCSDKFLYALSFLKRKSVFLKTELGNKQIIIENLINLLNKVTTKRD